MPNAKHLSLYGLMLVIAFLLGTTLHALPDPLKKAPSFLKFNSNVVKGTTRAPAGQALLADGSSASVWGNVEGVNVASNVSGSPAAGGTVLTADGAGKASWVAGGGGTGASQPNFCQAYFFAGNGTAANTFTVPAGVTKILVEAWGGGGGGGGGAGGNNSGFKSSGGGSGAPGLYRRQVVSVPSGTLVVAVGKGGTAGPSGSPGGSGGNGGAGGNSTVSTSGGAVVFSAAGGGGGAGASQVSAGVAGQAPATTAGGVQLAAFGVSGEFGGPEGAETNAVFAVIPQSHGGRGGPGVLGNLTSQPGQAGTDGLVIVSY